MGRILRKRKKAPEIEEQDEDEIGRMPFVFCAGGGMIGTSAANTARSLGMTVVIVDNDPKCLMAESGHVIITDLDSVDLHRTGMIQLIIGDDVPTFLSMAKRRYPDTIVPASGGHFAAKVVREHLKSSRIMTAPNALLLKKVADQFPKEYIVAYDESNGVLALSYMLPRGICQLDCAQPPRCPVTRLMHVVPMHERVRAILSQETSHATSLVTGSLGITGTIAGADLRDMMASTEHLRRGDTFAVATSCKCHSIANFFMVK